MLKLFLFIYSIVFIMQVISAPPKLNRTVLREPDDIIWILIDWALNASEIILYYHTHHRFESKFLQIIFRSVKHPKKHFGLRNTIWPDVHHFHDRQRKHFNEIMAIESLACVARVSCVGSQTFPTLSYLSGFLRKNPHPTHFLNTYYTFSLLGLKNKVPFLTSGSYSTLSIGSPYQWDGRDCSWLL